MKFSEFLSETTMQDDIHVGNIDLDGQNLHSLSRAKIPEKIGGIFSCRLNMLSSLTGGPKVVLHDYKASKNELSDFSGFPEHVGMTLWLQHNKFTSLKNIHKTLKACHGGIILDDNPLRTHVLGLLLVKGLAYVRMDDIKIENIINKHLPNNRGNDGVLDCQNALIDAGYSEYAQL